MLKKDLQNFQCSHLEVNERFGNFKMCGVVGLDNSGTSALHIVKLPSLKNTVVKQ